MTFWEIVRMVCYVVGAPALLYLALWLTRHRLYVAALGVGALSALFVWYTVEITIAATGLNTREYRVIGTPMVLMITVSAVLLVAHVSAKGK